MDVDDLRAIALFDGLTDAQLRELTAAGQDVRFEAGEELFRQRRPADHWWVLLAGSIGLFRQVGHEETTVAMMNSPGQWAGGLRAWDPHGAYIATGRGIQAGRVLRVPAELLRERVNAWFPFGVHLISGLATTVRNIESATREREALVSLGRLAAGLAHEINNPASAAASAVDALEEMGEALLSSSAARFAELDALRREVDPAAARLDPLAVADRETELSDWLTRHGVTRDWVIAPALAAAGVDVAWCERAAAVLDGGSLEAGLEWVANSLSMTALLHEAKESIRRISDLVGAVRSYAQLDRAPMQRTEVAEGLESTLVMLAHKFGPGVTVLRDYGDAPPIETFGAELNQVWTHLIDNAVDAMNGVGTLRISTRADGAGLVVEIGDTGPGMSEEARAHAFEPFFTTKGVGEGTGLGLDIARRIVVDRHGGEITIDQRPQETVLRVRLPPRPTTRP